MSSERAAGKPWLKGVLGALAALGMVTVVLAMLIAIGLLIISMEEGAASLSGMSVPLTLAVLLLSQGIGFTTDSMALTIMPLLLTAALVWTVRTVVKRTSTDARSYLSGALTWMVVNWLFAQNVSVVLDDSTTSILLKTAAVYTIGFALAVLSDSRLVAWISEHVSGEKANKACAAVSTAIKLTAVIVVVYLVLGLISVAAWVVFNYTGMQYLFRASGMQMGSRIVTTVATLAWLPNLCIWAVSWLFGGGFAIGDLAKFTLWTGESSGLPPVPIFGIFPDAVSNGTLRMVLVSLPLVCGLVVGLMLLFAPSHFAVTRNLVHSPINLVQRLVSLLYPLGSFLLGGALVYGVFAALFSLSDGALGKQRLSHVGVNVRASLDVTAKQTAMGLGAAWLAALTLVALVSAVRVLVRSLRQRGSRDEQPEQSRDAAPDDTVTSH